MYARATSGDKPNNNKFSICSVRNISAVLMKKRDDCFVGRFCLSLLCSCVCESDSVFMLLCLCVQSLASLSVVMVSWNLERSVTAAMLISAMTPAATTPMKGRTRSANSNPAKCAGQICRAGLSRRSPVLRVTEHQVLFSAWLVLWLLLSFWSVFFSSTVPAKARVAHPCALLRAQMINADWSPSVPKRACATESPLCVLPQNQRKTSPRAIQKHKSASVGYVGFGFPFCCLRCSMCSVYFNWWLFFSCSLLAWDSCALVPFVRSITWRYARVPLKMKRMRQPSCATCAVWRKVSRRPQIAPGSEYASKLMKQLCNKLHGLGDIVSILEVAPPPTVKPTTCSSSGSDRWAKFFNKTVTTLQPGSPCNDFKGYCDVFMRCRLVDADGPLARLKKAIFNAELYENIAEWIVVSLPVQETQKLFLWCFQPVFNSPFNVSFLIQDHWWAVLLMGIALIMLMAGFIKICSVHTPSSNPKLPPPKPLPGTHFLHCCRLWDQDFMFFAMLATSLALVSIISMPHSLRGSVL